MDLSFQSSTWLNWAKQLPDELIRVHPVLCLGYAWALLNSGELEASESWLRAAESWIDPPQASAAQMVVVDEADYQALPAAIAGARAYRALALGDIAGTIEYARQTLALAAADDHVRRIQATALLGIAEYASGNLQSAERSILDFQASMWQAGDVANALGMTFILANIWLAQGRLHEAVSAFQRALQVAVKRGASTLIGTSDLYRGLSELLCEQGDLEQAAQHLSTAQQLGELSALTGWPHRLGVAQARLKEAQGDLSGALELLDKAERQYVRNPLPDQPIAAMKARLWVRQGQLSEATAWAREQNLSPDDELSYLREYDHLTLARVLIARYRNDRDEGSIRDARRLLDRLLKAAEDGGRTGSAIEILILQALAYHAQGDTPSSVASFERALSLAEPEGYVQVFKGEGQPVADLLPRMKDEGGRRKEYIYKLLTTFGAKQEVHPSSFILPPLLEPLSERELEVLKLLGTELSGPEIADRLSVSLNTVRTHTKNIYSKLGVSNRRAVIRRAEELGLL
jgi:LuxR family maltose regulon positive regulatory protein